MHFTQRYVENSLISSWTGKVDDICSLQFPNGLKKKFHIADKAGKKASNICEIISLFSREKNMIARQLVVDVGIVTRGDIRPQGCLDVSCHSRIDYALCHYKG